MCQGLILQVLAQSRNVPFGNGQSTDEQKRTEQIGSHAKAYRKTQEPLSNKSLVSVTVLGANLSNGRKR
jgi:hypothetical protein